MSNDQGAVPSAIPYIRLSRKHAKEFVETQIRKGNEIRALVVNTEEDLEIALARKYKWEKYNSDLLNGLFTNDLLSNEFNRAIATMIGYSRFDDRVEQFRQLVRAGITCLESILERLEILPELADQVAPESLFSTRDIFIVHGQDDAVKETVARFVEKLGLRAIILHEQPNAGRTIIEKFEDHSNVGFAIVLMTPDDIGAPMEKKDEIKLRARQNVILELGYFMGKLGRGKVCALYKEGVEIPSDYQGVLYIPMDASGTWKMALAKEIKNAGIEVDLNKVL